MKATDETSITEIELLPDGRVCVFGTSREVLELFDKLQGGNDEAIRRRLNVVRERIAPGRDDVRNQRGAKDA